MTTTAGVEFCYYLAEKDIVQTIKIHVGTRRSKGMMAKEMEGPFLQLQ
jgi:hypothetical protein